MKGEKKKEKKKEKEKEDTWPLQNVYINKKS